MSETCVGRPEEMDSALGSGGFTLSPASPRLPLELSAAHTATVNPPVNQESAFLGHLKLIETVLATVARRNRLSADEADEFRSSVLLKIVENDYQVLRNCKDVSRLRSYLAVVCQRLMLDQRNQRWGKWRPSSMAKREGPVAVLLERLLYRERLPLTEAISLLRHRYQVAETDAALVQMASSLPPRLIRRPEVEDAAEEIADAGPLPDAVAIGHELGRKAAATRESLGRALASLDSETRLFLKMFFWDGLTLAQIARTLAIPQRPLYRRLESVLEDLRKRLESDPSGAEARHLVETRWSDYCSSADERSVL